jgi:hypothetical protein
MIGTSGLMCPPRGIDTTRTFTAGIVGEVPIATNGTLIPAD